MRIFHLSIALVAVALHSNLFADKQSNDAAEKQRQENRQEQLIQERKLEDQRVEQRRLDQERINRQLEDRRQEQRRLDNARDRRLVADRDRERRNDSLEERDDLLDDTLRARMVEQAESQYYQTQYQNTTASEPQTGCPSCPAGNMTSQDRQTLNQLETQEQCEEVNYEQRKTVVEQWDHDHSRD